MSGQDTELDARFCAIASDSAAGRLLHPIVDGWAAAWPHSALRAAAILWTRAARHTLRRSAIVVLVVATLTSTVVTALAAESITAVEWGGRALVVLVALLMIVRGAGERA